MKEIKDYLTELERINNDISNLEFQQSKAYLTLIDRIMHNCRTDIHPEVLSHLSKVQKINKIGYWVHDIRRKLFMGTRELLQFLGADPKMESFSEEDFFALIHKDDLDRIMQSYSKDIYAHEDRSSAYRMISLKSELKYVISHFSCKYDKDGNPIQATGVIFEIPQTENKSKDSQSTLKKDIITANMGVGFWEYTPNVTTEYWSTSLYDIIETSPEESSPVLATIEKLITSEDSSELSQYIEHKNSTNSDYEVTFKIKTFKGNFKILFSQVHHLVDSNGQLIKRYGLVYDVTKMKQLLK